MEAVAALRNRVALTTAYAAGLRIGEVCRLKVTSIDSKRMLIHVEAGKGAKDSYAIPMRLVTIRPHLRERMRFNSSNGARRRGMDVRPQITGFLIRRKVGVFRHPGRGIEPDPMPGPLRHDERDAPPMCGRPPGMSCPVRQNHVTLALASLPIGLGAMVAMEARLGVGLRQPAGSLAASEPLQHIASPADTHEIIPLADRGRSGLPRRGYR